VPGPTPDTVPDALTVAAAGLEDAQGVVGCAVPDPVSEMVDPTQTSVDPVIEHAAPFLSPALVKALTKSRTSTIMLVKKPLFLRIVNSQKGYLVDSLSIIG
jgi:hypothetical protein